MVNFKTGICQHVINVGPKKKSCVHNRIQAYDLLNSRWVLYPLSCRDGGKGHNILLVHMTHFLLIVRIALCWFKEWW